MDPVQQLQLRVLVCASRAGRMMKLALRAGMKEEGGLRRGTKL